MRIPTFATCFSLLAIISISPFAQAQATNGSTAPDLPPFMLEGLHDLANQNPEEAEKAWTRGTISLDQQVAYASTLRSVMESAGAFQNFDVVSAHDFSPRLRVVYLSLNFERMPEIVRFLLYRTSNGWVVVNQDFNVDTRSLEPAAESSGQ
jgi:hypothetical protein